MPTCDIAIIIVCAGRHGTTERRAGAPGMNTSMKMISMKMIFKLLHSCHGFEIDDNTFRGIFSIFVSMHLSYLFA